MFEDIKFFLDTYPRGRQCSLQTFDDKGNNPKLARIFEATDENIKKAIELNKKGAGVFFSVNTMLPGKRDKASVQNLNAYFTEIDYGTKDDQIKLIESAPIAPSLVIESKNGFHIYYYAKEQKEENWGRIMRGLCNYYGGDSKVIDTSRVLRVPGTHHNKQEPYLIEMWTCRDKQFTEEEMMSAFTDHRTNKEKEAEYRAFETNIQNHIGGNFWERVKQINTKTALEKMSGHKFVSNEMFTFRRNNNGTDQIIVNGKPTSNRIDKAGKPAVGAGTTGGGNRVSYVFRYGKCDGSSLAKRINANFPEIAKQEDDNKFNKKAKFLDKVIEAPEEMEMYDKKKLITRGNIGVDKSFGMLHNDYCMVFGGAGEGKTLWTTWLAAQNGKQGKKVMFVTMELTPKALKSRYAIQTMGLKKYDAQTKEYSQEEKDVLNLKYKEFDKYFDLIGLPSPTIDDLAEAIKLYTKNGYQLFILDNLGKIGTGGNHNELDQQKIISSKLQQLKNELGVTIILVHHKNKKGEMRGNTKLKDDVTLMIELSRNYVLNTTELVLEKITEGDVDCFEAQLLFDKGSFTDYKI